MGNYPLNTKAAIGMETLIKHKEALELHERMSSRMVKCASVLDRNGFIGWNMRVPKKGLAEMSIFGSESLCTSDLEWILEHMATYKKLNLKNEKRDAVNNELFELTLPIAENQNTATIGFGAVSADKSKEEPVRWPVRYSTQFAEIIKVFQNMGAEFRAVVGSADLEERQKCKKALISTWTGRDSIDDYAGKPVRARFLLRLPEAPSVRLLTVLEEAIPGINLLYHGQMTEDLCERMWENPIVGAVTLPDYAARILIMEPVIEESMIGIEVSEEKVKPIPVSHKNTKTKNAVVIGRAIATTGAKRKITIGELDLRRHYQIIGQTGTGKSTLLSTTILSAIEQGYGLTFFDPHGSTIDNVLQCIPEKYIDKVRVVRIGDAENPVPLNIWDSDDPRREERTISDLCELFADIFDPHREGFVGPRYERWLSTFCKASIAFLGRRASFESIAVISQSQDNMLKVSKAIYSRYPELVETIKEEYGKDKSNDFQGMLNWYLCKFQRLTSVEQLRKTLGAGTNALDFSHSIDTDTVTLIDLASPIIGTHASRIVGTMLLMKLWNAAMSRKNRDRTHMVVVDEASLFQTNPMPRMLAESRKFGISMVLCHQHTGQLTQEIKDALEANSANFSAFRLSPRDALGAAIRFDNPDMQMGLTRLDAYKAVTTLSVDGQQTQPFTLETIRPGRQRNAAEISERIEKNSIDKLVKPYRSLRALTSAEILDYLNHPEKIGKSASNNKVQGKGRKEDDTAPEWLLAWKKKREELKKAS